MNTDKLPILFKSLLQYRRQVRFKFMISKVTTKDGISIIDIGCGVNGRSFEDFAPPHWKITGIDILPENRISHNHPNFRYIKQSASNLDQFRDQQFDLAISIGMLEHITDDTTFNEIVSEIRRVAKQYIIVVPFKYGWIEPHYAVPFFPVLPYGVKVTLVKIFNLCNERNRVKDDPDVIRKNTRWLSNKEYLIAFPDASIHIMPTFETIAIIKSSTLI